MRQQLIVLRQQWCLWNKESGTGQFSTVFGVAFFIGLLMLTTEVLLTLHRASAVQAAASDAAHATAQAVTGSARRSCGADLAPQAALRAEMLLGSAATAEVTCVTAEIVRVTVEAPGVPIGGVLGPRSIRRSAEVHLETASGLS